MRLYQVQADHSTFLASRALLPPLPVIKPLSHPTFPYHLEAHKRLKTQKPLLNSALPASGL
jgi:hypothetical protein